MHVIIRLSQAGLKAENAKPQEERVRVKSNTDEYNHYMTPETPEQQATEDTLAETQPLRLGNFTPSTITRQPLVIPVAYDAAPTNEEVWQQLEVMASQFPAAVNDAITAF